MFRVKGNSEELQNGYTSEEEAETPGENKRWLRRGRVERREEEGMGGVEDGKCRANGVTRKVCLAALEGKIRGPSSSFYARTWLEISLEKKEPQKINRSLPSSLSPQKGSFILHPHRLSMAEDVDMLDATRPPLPHRSPDPRPPLAASPPASSTSTGASRRSSLAALMNPEPVSDHDDSQHEESEVEAETHPAPEEYEDEDEEDEEGTSGDDEDDDDEDSEGEGEEGDDSTKDSILIADSHGPSAASTVVPEDATAAATNTTKDSSASRSISIPVLIHPPSNPATSSASPGDSGHTPSVSAPPGPVPGSSKPASSAKPRSKKPRSPSPSPPPPPPPPPLKTIRLDIKLGGPDNYEVDVSKMAKESGQRPPTPPPRIAVNKHHISESEADTDSGKKKKRRVCAILLICEFLELKSLCRKILRRIITMCRIRLSMTLSLRSMSERTLLRRSSKGSMSRAARLLFSKTSMSFIF